jgi:hypothetical protein
MASRTLRDYGRRAALAAVAAVERVVAVQPAVRQLQGFRQPQVALRLQVLLRHVEARREEALPLRRLPDLQSHHLQMPVPALPAVCHINPGPWNS